MSRAKTFLALLPSLTVLALPAQALDPGAEKYENLLTPLLESSETIVGQPFAYPDGAPKVTAAIVTIPPGNDTGWHIHQVPLFAYVLEGEISVDYGSKVVKVYKTGDSLMEAMNWPHNATNKTDMPMKIMAVYMGTDGVPNAEPVDGPE